MLFSSHHVKGIYYQHDLLLWCWTFSPGWGSVCQVSPLQSSFLSPFHAYTLELKSHYAHLILRTGELVTLLPHFLLNLLPWIFFTEHDLGWFSLHHFEFLNIGQPKCPVSVMSTFSPWVQLIPSSGISTLSCERLISVTLALALLLSSKLEYLCNINLQHVTVQPLKNWPLHLLSFFVSTNSFFHSWVVQAWKLRVIPSLSCWHLIQ